MSDSNTRIVVRTHSLNYAEKRLFAGIPLKNYEVKKLIDFVRFPAHLYWRIKKKPHPFLTNLFCDFGLNKYQLLHFFNAINMGNQPWLTTFERYLPRDAHHPGVEPKENWYINYVLKRVAHKSCKKLIAISDYAYRSQVRYLEEYGKYQNEILSKIIVLHPPQKLMIQHWEEKKKDPDFTVFTIVGADFFRKGGMEILHVFERLFKEKRNVKLNIVSSLDFGDYASLATAEDQKKATAIIDTYDQISHYTAIPNTEVMDILLKTDIGLLPTYDDTYGYFVLECQAFGCPVISTNGGALPEINNNEVGWMIDVPLFKDGRSLPKEPDQKITFSTVVEEKLYEYVLEALNNPGIIKQKGEKAMQRILKEHDMDVYTKRMEEIYTQALA